MEMYHFTSPDHIEEILSLGVLYAVESDLSIAEQFAAPSCVWFTTDPNPSGKHGLGGSAADKEAIRITVEVPDEDVVVWSEWADSNSMNSKWRRILTKIAGGREVVDTWRLVFRPVHSDEWVSVENLRTGETYDVAKAGRTYDERFFGFTQSFVPNAVASLKQRMRLGLTPILCESDIRKYLVKQFVRHEGCCPVTARRYDKWLSGTGFPRLLLDNVYCGLLPLGCFATGTKTTPLGQERAVINRRLVA